MAVPMFFNRGGKPVALENSFPGSSAFLVCGGPSLASHDLSQLARRGVLTLGVNNAATIVRPQLWVCVDDPSHFADGIWRDPAIWKFVPQPHMAKRFAVRGPDASLRPADRTVGEMPAVYGYRRNEEFVPERWLDEDTFNWGNHSKTVDADGQKGSRSVFLVALRLLYVLGVRTVYLIGCDFRMKLDGVNYAFEQHRSPSSVRGNNKSYQVLNVRLARLKPHFDRVGFNVFNCTPNSGLTVFPSMEFTRAIAEATAEMPVAMLTAGMYDQKLKKDTDKATKTSGTVSSGKDLSQTASIAPASPKRIQETAVKKTLRPIVDFTTVVGVDDAHLVEWKKTWPTWVAHRPEILTQPLLLICDGARPESYWREALSFLDHPTIRMVLWSQPGAGQRTKMLTGITLGPAEHLDTPWFLKLDTDAVAMGPAKWIRPEWFMPDPQGRDPVFVAPSWNYSKPANAIRKLDDWADTCPEFGSFPRLDLPFKPGAKRLIHARMISWCIFGRSDWLREITALCRGKLPFPSHDTFLWFCAARRRDFFRSISMRESRWVHTFGRDPVTLCERALQSTELEPSVAPVEEVRAATIERPASTHALKLLELLDQCFPQPLPIVGAEVGVSNGETSHALLSARPTMKLIMVDLWNGAGESDRPEKLVECRHYRAALSRTTAVSDRRILLPKGSISAAGEIPDGTLDFVFLDADHRYEFVHADLMAWWPKLKVGGLMSGHDFGHRHDRSGRWGVRKAVDAWAARLCLTVDVCPVSTVWSIRKTAEPLVSGDSRVSKASVPSPHVFYLLTRAGHGPRLAVSIWSLRRYYRGPVTVYTALPESHEIGQRIAADPRCNVEHRTLPYPNLRRNSSYVAKPSLVREVPESSGLFLDADTLVAGDISPIFEALDDHPFVASRFMEWSTTKPWVRRRVENWKELAPKHKTPERLARMIEAAASGHPMINSGVFAWRSDSELRKDWYDLTLFGHRKFICDEVALQILLPHYQHRLLDCRFNCSSTYGKERSDVRIWHFHGGRHLRAGKGRELWLPAFRRCLEDNPGDLRDWAVRIEPELAKWVSEEPNVPQEPHLGQPQTPSMQ